MGYGESRLVAVQLVDIPGLKYGLRTSIASASSTKLGHIPAIEGGNPIRGLVLGINSPKPPRAKKRFASTAKNYEASYVEPTAIDTARADGWTISLGKPFKGRVSTKYSKLVYVDHKVADAVMEGNTESLPGVIVKYAWRMPTYQYTQLGAERATLGITDVTLNDLNEIIYGANSTKPARVSKEIVVNGNPAKITTFVAHNKADNLPNGWA
jgi:hypothetical protein